MINPIKWAVIFSIVMLLWITLEKLTGLHSEHIDKHPLYTNFFSIAAIAVYVLALLDKRKRDFDGVMNYKQGVIAGILITIFITILTPLTQFINSSIILTISFVELFHEGPIRLKTSECKFSWLI